MMPTTIHPLGNIKISAHPEERLSLSKARLEGRLLLRTARKPMRQADVLIIAATAITLYGLFPAVVMRLIGSGQ